MKLRDIRNLLRVFVGRKGSTVSDQHLHVRTGREREADSDQHLQQGLEAGAFVQSDDVIPANAGRNDPVRQNGCAANAARDWFDVTPRSEELGERARPDEVAIDPYSPVPAKSKFERRMDAAKNPRRRKHKLHRKTGAAFVRPATRLEAVLDDLRTDERVYGRDCTTQFLPCLYDITRPSGAEVLARAGMAIAAAAVMDVGESIAHKLCEKREAADRESHLAVRRMPTGTVPCLTFVGCQRGQSMRGVRRAV